MPYHAISVAFAAILTATILSDGTSPGLLFGWTGAVLVTSWISISFANRLHAVDSGVWWARSAPALITLGAAVRAAVWVVMPVLMFPGASPLLKASLFGLTVCVATGALGLAAVPLAAFAWTGVCAVAMMWMLYSDPFNYPLALNLLPALFAAIMLFGLFRLGQMIVDQASDNTRLKDQNRSVTQLIEEYEHRGGAWLWETDQHHRLVYISPQIGLILGQASGTLRDQSFPAIFGGSLVLSSQLQKMAAFEKAEFEITTRGGPRWMSVSGTPKSSRMGGFDGYRGIGFDVTETKISNDRLVNLAKIDSLTGLPNRAFIRQLFEEGLAQAEKGFGQCGMLFLDLDGFKPVNDTYGHSKGDALLKAVAGRLTNAVAGYGQVGRIGGDEFAVVLPNIDGRKAMQVLAERLIAVVSETYLIDQSRLNIGCSIGGAMGPSDGRTVEELLKRSDLALYNAKNDGRGIYRHFDLDLQKKIDHRVDMERALKEALEEGQFELHYQPIVSAQSPQIVGFEALIRWEHPTRGRMSPADFIPVAEEVGLIADIGAWALKRACTDAMQWPSHISVSVNVSPLQLLSNAFPSIVGDALTKSRLSPNRLELEVTESIFLTDGDGALRTLKQLQSQGIRVALDDFGTGYSSLGYLNKAIFNKLKIDRSFVREAGIKKEAVLIVQAIVALASSFHMTITAEGVETADELKLMRDLGCHQIQGYIYSKPMPYAKTFELFQKKDSRKLAS
jgi:diguanylate cyclase (GGDEF)-like protein